MAVSFDGALIVVDVQNDFCTGGALAVPGGEEVVEPINSLLGKFAATVFTQDWHPPNHASFASNHSSKTPFDSIELEYGPQVLWPDHCVIGSNGAQFRCDLKDDCADLVIRKGFRPTIDSYSAFFENDRNTPTGLEGYLQTRGIRSVCIVGLALDYCVRFSAVDAATLGFSTTVVECACREIDLDNSGADARSEMRECGIELTGMPI
ncbi:MAG: bifunctional nicotinamidase/pyrazinamidase [Albidovulum sp.]|nr:bifunctional nicotinamidase/pyrazinamidase [Albidovulum sp.]MDE0532254.1 bifunctional nicotinamidase/pyrazinamidase [Albidovulum sp.]